MISRRNIRVKVMQLIYAMETIEETNGKNDPGKILQKQLDQTRELFLFLIYFLSEVARYAETDSRLRASRHLLTAEDMNVNVKIAGNELLWKILGNDSYKKTVLTFKPQLLESHDLVKKMYLQLTASDLYKTYISVQGRDKQGEKEIIKFIFTDLMLPDEDFNSFLEEHFSNWDDDGEMMQQLILNFLQKPATFNFDAVLSLEKSQFARNLLRTTLEKRDFVAELIKPKLKNWDAERIAVLDMILMRMGVCELLYFETIPPKVTINEYIDIAKEYSTEQSGHFINGILDGIHKDLIAQNKLHKIDFKQKTS